MGYKYDMNVVVPGTFDLFHEGHKRLLDYAWMMGDVTVTINSCRFSEELGKSLFESDQARTKNILDYAHESNQPVEVYVVYSEAESLARTLEKAPCFRLTGTDWNLAKTSKRCEVPEDFWEAHEVYLVYKDRLPNISSTILRNAKTN